MVTDRRFPPPWRRPIVCRPEAAGSVNSLMLSFCWVVYYDGMRGAKQLPQNRMIAFQ
jgi:hypothetical protein